MTMQEIRDLAEKYTEEYLYVGIRTQEEPFELGEINHCSSVWVDGDETDETLDGISVTSIDSRAVKMHSDEHDSWSGYYYGDHQAIICGNIALGGEDEGELIIMDAIVVEIIK